MHRVLIDTILPQCVVYSIDRAIEKTVSKCALMQTVRS